MNIKNKNVDARAIEIAANPHINIITYTFSFDYVPSIRILLSDRDAIFIKLKTIKVMAIAPNITEIK